MPAVVEILKNGSNVNEKDTHVSLTTSFRYTSQFISIYHRTQARDTLFTILPFLHSIKSEIFDKIEILKDLFTILLFSLQHYITNFHKNNKS